MFLHNVWQCHAKVFIAKIYFPMRWQYLKVYKITSGTGIKNSLSEKKSDCGVTAKDNRIFINAVMWIVKQIFPGRDFPESYGKWNKVHWDRKKFFVLEPCGLLRYLCRPGEIGQGFKKVTPPLLVFSSGSRIFCTRYCSQIILRHTSVYLICSIAQKNVAFFTYLVAMVRHRLRCKKVFSTRWPSLYKSLSCVRAFFVSF